MGRKTRWTKQVKLQALSSLQRDGQRLPRPSFPYVAKSHQVWFEKGFKKNQTIANNIKAPQLLKIIVV